jgi:hypothetical protein
VAERNFITPYKIRNKTATIHPKVGGYVNVSSGNIRVGRNNIAALQTSTVHIRTLRNPETSRTSTEYVRAKNILPQKCSKSNCIGVLPFDKNLNQKKMKKISLLFAFVALFATASFAESKREATLENLVLVNEKNNEDKAIQDAVESSYLRAMHFEIW